MSVYFVWTRRSLERRENAPLAARLRLLLEGDRPLTVELEHHEVARAALPDPQQ